MVLFSDMDVKMSYLLFAFLVSLLSPHVESIAVMSVDLGSEWMKIAIVSVNFITLYNLLNVVNNILLNIFFSVSHKGHNFF